MSAATASWKAGARTWTPNWPPSASPAGTATAQRSSRFAQLVKTPSFAFSTIGSASTAAIVGWAAVVGRRIASRSANSAPRREREAVELLLVGEELGRGRRGRGGDDLPDRGIDLVGVRFDELPDRRVPLGDERAAVEEGAGVEQRRDVDLHDLGARGNEPIPSGSECRARVLGEGAERIGRRRADAGAGAIPRRLRLRSPLIAGGGAKGTSVGAVRLSGSAGSGPAITASASSASPRSRAKIDTQSSDLHAGTTPVVGTSPRVGFTPTIPWNAAGTRPEPAVSVPRAMSAMPRATATAEPELEPPETYSGRRASRTAP